MIKDLIEKRLPGPMPADMPAFASPLWPLMPFGPTVDGTDVGLPDVPYKMIVKGDFAKVPLIVGANHDGGAYFGPIIPWLWSGVAADFNRTLEWFLLNKTDQDRIRNEYSSDFPNDWKRTDRFIRDLTFQCSDRDVASAWSKAGLPVYLYVFSFDFTGGVQNLLGDAHAFELPFVWRNFVEVLGWFSKESTPANYDQMAKVMSCSWASFVRCKAPRCETNPPRCDDTMASLPRWPVVSVQERQYMSLKAISTVEVIGSKKIYPQDEFPGDNRCDIIGNLDLSWQPLIKNVQKRWLDGAARQIQRAFLNV